MLPLLKEGSEMVESTRSRHVLQQWRALISTISVAYVYRLFLTATLN